MKGPKNCDCFFEILTLVRSERIAALRQWVMMAIILVMKPDKKKMQNEWMKKILSEDRDTMEIMKVSRNSRKRSFLLDMAGGSWFEIEWPLTPISVYFDKWINKQKKKIVLGSPKAMN
jgi:hypothetical protein